jgi:transposase
VRCRPETETARPFVHGGEHFVWVLRLDSRDLDLTPSSLANWVRHARADRTKGKTELTTAEREELAGLRKENRILAEERDILKKAAAFFAKQSR